MRTIASLGLATLVGAAVASCSSPSNGPGDGQGLSSNDNGDDGGAASSGDKGSSAGTGGNAGGGSSGTGSGNTGSGAGSSGKPGGTTTQDAGSAVDGGLSVSSTDDPANDPEIAATYTITTQTFSVPPGGEVFKCQTFANPFNGQQVDIKTWEANMAVGSHHMFVFYQSGATNGSIADCSGLQIAPFTFVAQGPHVYQTYPEGVGATIPTSMGFMVNVHFINTGSTTLTAQVKVNMYVTKPGVVTKHAGSIFVNNPLLSEPADGQPHTFTKTCAIGNTTPITVVASNSHMHKTATQFTSSIDGVPLYSTSQWSDPPLEAPPGGAMQVAQGASETFACTYAPTQTPLSFGESVNNIMCIGQAIFYPAQNISSPFLGCSIN
jgi:hypothetical protein